MSVMKLFISFNYLMAIENPLTLYHSSLNTLHNNFDSESRKIITRIYPNFFNNEVSYIEAGIGNLFFKEALDKKEIDLAFLDIQKIPVKLASKLRNVEVLDLSGNSDLSINEDWFQYFYSNLKELTINEHNLSEKDFGIISKLKVLEKLIIKKSRILDIYSENFISVLKNIKYLDVSECSLDYKALKHILEYGENLEYLNFFSNDLSNAVHFNVTQEERSDDHYQSSQKRCNFFNIHQTKRIQIRNLKRLNLSACNIKSKKFIKSIFDIEGLERLNLSYNRLKFDFKDIVKGKASSSLKELRLRYAKLDSLKVIEYLTNFIALEVLDISGNELKNSLENIELGCSKYSLKSIRADHCKFKHNALKAFTDCPNLEKLEVPYNDFSEMPAEFTFGQSKKSLKYIDIGYSELNHSGLRAVTGCSSLEKLDISGNIFGNITNDLVLTASKDTLTELNISCTKMNCYGLSFLTNFSKIQKLIAFGNNFENIPENFSFGPLKDSLIDLNVNDCRMNTQGLKKITECNKIEHLKANSNNFKDLTSEFTFYNLRNSLKYLELMNCKLNHNGLKAATDCLYLEILDVSRNNFDSITDDFLIGSSKYSLEKIEIESCNLSNYHFLRKITDCLKLTSLNISHNNFGTIPENFSFGCSKDTLVSLNMESCKLKYHGLKAITECSRITKLIVSESDFSNIPPNFTFDQLRQSLQSLDISSSKLNYYCLRAIPDCQNLKTLDLSNNNLRLDDARRIFVRLNNLFHFPNF